MLALLAMLVPQLTMLLHRPPMPQAAASISTAMPDCGMDMGQSRPKPDKAPAHKMPACPICQSLHLLGNGFVPPAPPVIALLVVALAVAVFACSAFFFRRPLPPQARPRAPPVFVQA